jgi:PKD repeat protein
MKTSRFISGMVAIVATILMFYACSKEESHPKPEALFSYTIGGDGRTINFTNESTNATSYTWDFGDGQTSTEVNPVHTFAEYKENTITLTAKGPGGENVFTYKLTVTKASPVKLDDNAFDDWSTIPDAFVSVDNNGGIINRVKLDYDGDYILFLYGSSGQSH